MSGCYGDKDKLNEINSTIYAKNKIKNVIIKIKILRVYHMLLLVSCDSVSHTFQHIKMKDHGKTAVEVLPTLL